MAGNLTQRQTASGTTTYTYTAQHRLSVAETPEAVVGCAYDAAGRRIMRTEAAVAAGPAGDAPLQKDAVATGAHRSVYRYDGSSRMVSSRVEMELSGVADVKGLVKPVNPGGGRYRPAPAAALPGGTTASSRSTFSEVSVGRRTLSVTGPEGSRFLSHDVLGSIRTATGTTGMVIEHYQYDAYGETLSGATSHHQPYGYNGKPRDPATGLTDYGFRDYLPQAGRFVTVDPIKDGVNWYAYVNADPVNFVDAWGLENVSFAEDWRMQDVVWGGEPLGNSNDASHTVGSYGCYVTILANAASTLSGSDDNPFDVNEDTDNFPDDSHPSVVNAPSTQQKNIIKSSFYGDAFLASNGLEMDRYLQSQNGDLSDIIDQLHDADTQYAVVARVTLTGANGDSPHWIGVEGAVVEDPTGVNEGDYVRAQGSSESDNPSGTDRNAWVQHNGEVYIPVSELEEVRAIHKEN